MMIFLCEGIVVREIGRDTSSLVNFKDEMDWMITSKLRRIVVSGVVSDAMAMDVISRVWYLYTLDSAAPITLVINSGGGSVVSGFAIWDQLRMLDANIYTVVTGIAASMATVLALIAPEEKRFATANARFMIHQPSISGVIEGQVSDLEIQAYEIRKTRETIVKIYVEETGGDYDVLYKDVDRDHWMNTEEALSRNFIKKIISDWSDIK